MVDKIKSIEDLEQAKSAASAQGSTIPNYQEWSSVLSELDEAGVKSTGSFEGDKAKLKEVHETVQEFIEKLKAEQAQEEKNKQLKNDTKVQKDNVQSDNEQNLKATVANGTSSMIMADYMKYYHLLS